MNALLKSIKVSIDGENFEEGLRLSLEAEELLSGANGKEKSSNSAKDANNDMCVLFAPKIFI
jgi:hypothetical protein